MKHLLRNGSGWGSRWTDFLYSFLRVAFEAGCGDVLVSAELFVPRFAMVLCAMPARNTKHWGMKLLADTRAAKVTELIY